MAEATLEHGDGRYGMRRGAGKVTGPALALRSPAKINWTLRVVARRDDGFHEIESLLSAVTFGDELTFTGRSDSAIELSCDESGLATDGRNLVVQAALRLQAESGHAGGATCRLVKRIPIGGGLGGGSSNAAFTLLGLNLLWGLHWPAERLSALAGGLGSDVPFFLGGSSAVISGRGERVRPVGLPWRGWIVLLMPGLSISTAAVYGAWKPGASASEPADGLVEQSGVAAPDAVTWMAGTFNMLEAPAFRVCPQIQRVMACAEDLAGRPVRLSGSGSTLFTAFDTQAEAKRFAGSAASALGLAARVVQPLEQAGATGWDEE